MKPVNLNPTNFINSLKDYYYLINKNYPEKGSLKLTGDRYKHNRDERTIIYRGISSAEKVISRRKKIVKKIKGDELIVDAYIIELVFTNLSHLEPFKVTLYIDSPVSNSKKHKQLIELKMKEYNNTGQCFLVKSADHHIKKHPGCIIATSDTGIIDNCTSHVFDLPLFILNTVFKSTILQINKLLLLD